MAVNSLLSLNVINFKKQFWIGYMLPIPDLLQGLYSIDSYYKVYLTNA